MNRMNYINSILLNEMKQEAETYDISQSNKRLGV